VKARE
jgi:hypothetical protein